MEDSRNLQEELRQQIDLNGLEMLKSEQELEGLHKERSLHMAKLKVFEEKVDQLQLELRERSMESAEGIELHGKLLKQIESKDCELLSEKKKRKNVVDSYKRLKSQYNFLCTRNGLTPENMLTPNKKEDETVSVRHSPDPLTSPGTPFGPIRFGLFENLSVIFNCVEQYFSKILLLNKFVPAI